MPDPAAPHRTAHGDQATDYLEAGFNRRLGFGETAAVLIVDMCRAYFDEDSPLYAGVPETAEACVRLVAAARAAKVPVLWTRVEYEPGGADGGIFYRKVGALASFDRGSPLGDWLPELTPTPDDIVITKQYASAFFGTAMDEVLKAASVDTLVLGGVSTSGCVRASALDACQYGYVPIVVREACGDRDPAIHEASLFDLDAKYADVESLEKVLAML